MARRDRPAAKQGWKKPCTLFVLSALVLSAWLTGVRPEGTFWWAVSATKSARARLFEGSSLYHAPGFSFIKPPGWQVKCLRLRSAGVKVKIEMPMVMTLRGEGLSAQVSIERPIKFSWNMIEAECNACRATDPSSPVRQQAVIDGKKATMLLKTCGPFPWRMWVWIPSEGCLVDAAFSRQKLGEIRKLVESLKFAKPEGAPADGPSGHS